MSDPWPHDAGEPMTPEEWDEQWRGVRERTREQKAAHLREHGGCGHLPHQKCKIQGVGFVCLGCDPTWEQVSVEATDVWPFSLFVHTVGTQPMTEADWQDTEA